MYWRHKNQGRSVGLGQRLSHLKPISQRTLGSDLEIRCCAGSAPDLSLAYIRGTLCVIRPCTRSSHAGIMGACTVLPWPYPFATPCRSFPVMRDKDPFTVAAYLVQPTACVPAFLPSPDPLVLSVRHPSIKTYPKLPVTTACFVILFAA